MMMEIRIVNESAILLKKRKMGKPKNKITK